jgi:hypothetical protein
MVAATDQNDKALAVLAKVNAVARTEIDAAFEHSGAKPSRVGAPAFAVVIFPNVVL